MHHLVNDRDCTVYQCSIYFLMTNGHDPETIAKFKKEIPKTLLKQIIGPTIIRMEK